MIQFPATVAREWEVVATAADAEAELQRRLSHAVELEKSLEKMRLNYEAKILLQQELDAESTPVLQMTTLADYASSAVTFPPDLIDGVLPDEGVTLVLGPSGSGKSTLALQMLHSLLTGEDWLGQTTKPIAGSVGVVSYDMNLNMMWDWMSGFPNLDPTKVHGIGAHKTGNPLNIPDYRKAIATAWKKAGVEIVLVDSFSASFFGHDQNDAAATMSHYRDLKRFALSECEAKALIVIVHSTTGAPLKARGSSVHQDVADSIVGVKVDEKTQSREISMVKYRAARGQKGMAPVIVTAPDDVTHLVGLDTGAMSLAGLSMPTGFIAMTFPETYEEPVSSTQTAKEDDDL